jgi:SNF family Na+-dependent transporter
MSRNSSPERWASRIGVILAVAGSAVGLGNFLRFPGNAAANGGGAFMLPYFISLLVLGIPLCWAEWTMGRYGGLRGFNSAPGIFSVIWRNRFAKYFGGLALLIPLVIYMYYVLIEAWCLGYAIHYLTGDMKIDRPAISAAQSADSPEEAALGLGRVSRFYLQASELREADALRAGKSAEEARQAASEVVATESNRRAYAFGKFFNRLVGAEADGVSMEGANGILLVTLVTVFLGNFVLIYRGVNRGIELFCRVAMPIMAVLAIIVLIRVLTLGTPDPTKPDQSVMGGLAFMWNPHPEELRDPKTWLAAAGQIFFSLSVGFGIIINYSSYLSEKDDVVLSGLTSSSVNEFFEVCLGGLITLPAAFVFLGVATANYSGSTFALGFVALPNVFDNMPGGQVFGFLWFFMLFIAAITSSVSMLQPVIAFLEEGFGLKRHASAALLGMVAALGVGFVMYFSKDLVALDTFDFWVGSVMIFVLAMLQAILYGWVFGIDRGEAEAHRGAHIRIPRFVQWVLKYITPTYLLVIFALFCRYSLPGYAISIYHNPAARMSLGFIAVVFGFLLLLVHIAGERWKAGGRI